MEIRILKPGDEAKLERYLQPRTESSMILRSNLRRHGIAQAGEPLQGPYAAALSQGRVVGVVAHYRNLIPQAPLALVPRLARAAVAASGRPVGGAVGPAEQVSAALSALGLARARKRVDNREGLYVLDTRALRRPAVLNAQRLHARALQPRDRDPVVGWFVAYEQEALGSRPSRALARECERDFEQRCADGSGYVLLRDGAPVAYSGFNAALPDAVQVGGVYVPKAERRKGFARAVVAYSLEVARRRGVARAVLFTDDDNTPALAAYRALGFDRVADFRLSLLA